MLTHCTMFINVQPNPVGICSALPSASLEVMGSDAVPMRDRLHPKALKTEAKVLFLTPVL